MVSAVERRDAGYRYIRNRMLEMELSDERKLERPERRFRMLKMKLVAV